MSVAMNRTAIVMLASGLSRRYGRKDKMLADLGGQPLIEHAAHMITEVDPLTRVAVCPSDRPQIGERLINRFVVAVNKKPKMGLGHSIAVGVNVALQFKPDAILVVMGDMPFVESWILEGVVARLGAGIDIVHSGGANSVRPPTVFGPACFDALAALDGDDGAKQIIGQGAHNVVGFGAPPPLLMDIDTREDLDLARQQLAIRKRYEQVEPQSLESASDMDIAPIDLGQHRSAGVSFGAQRR
ncbi:MAG: nucleotidyltransferase family protein [Hyphomonadaceae bacterium]|nr:nucleotidyltransferase family protein [Hyphomonadaceae bacterium]